MTQSVRLAVLVACALCDLKIKSGKEEGPPSLSGVQSFIGLNVLQITVFYQNHKGQESTLQPMAPFFKVAFMVRSSLSPTS